MKVGQLFNVDSFKSFDFQKSFTDSIPGVVLERNLIQVDPTIFEKKYTELTFVNSGIEASNIGGYAEQVQSLRVRPTGDFKTAGDESSNKGIISIAGETSLISVYEKEAETKWTDTEVKQSAFQNINLPSRLVEAVNFIYLRAIDEIGYLGVEANAGLLNNSVFASSAAAGTIDALYALDPVDAYQAISGLIQDQWNGVNNTPEYMANTVVMPVRVMNFLTANFLSSTIPNETVMSALRRTYGGVNFVTTFRSDQDASTPTVAYNTNREAMQMRIPVPLMMGEVLKPGSFDFKMDAKYRVAGLDILESTAGRILTGL